jgi:hypothetical protein
MICTAGRTTTAVPYETGRTAADAARVGEVRE